MVGKEPQQILDMRLPVQINTISFNCNDPEANAFLEELAERTHGTHHHFLPFNAEQGQVSCPGVVFNKNKFNLTNLSEEQ